jgi:predicted helicase
MKIKNRIICVTGVGARGGLSALMLNSISDFNMLEAGAQCFPLNLYNNQDLDEGLFANQKKIKNDTIVDGITNLGLDHFKKSYKNNKVTKEDLFYYIYGILHSPSYVNNFKNNLSKEIPRIPVVKSFEDFMLFSKAGRKLGDLHVNYETVKPYEVTFDNDFYKNKKNSDSKSFYYVKNMKFFGKRPNQDKTKVIYNQNITIHNIPLEAYKYVVNRKPALEWIMELQKVKMDKESGILNDANDYANETMKNPAYPLELFRRIITVSLETMTIIKSLPKLKIN